MFYSSVVSFNTTMDTIILIKTLSFVSAIYMKTIFAVFVCVGNNEYIFIENWFDSTARNHFSTFIT